MKKMITVFFVLAVSCALVISGCSGGSGSGNGNGGAAAPDNAAATTTTTDGTNDGGGSGGNNGTAEEEVVVNTELSGEIDVWTWSPELYEVLLPGFNARYPNIKVNIVNLPDVPEKLKTALAAGTGAPDVSQMMVENYWQYNNIEGLENLLEEPYDIGRYQQNFPEGYWKLHMSMDGKRIWGVPFGAAPAVTFYRTDIMEQAGYPSDPAELAAYMEDPQNFLSMAQNLKAQDKYVLEFNDILMWLKGTGTGFFDTELNYVRNTDEFVELLDISKQVKQLGLAAGVSFHSDEGKQMLNTGKMAMIYAGDWFSRPNNLQRYAPDTSGKWRVTKLPLGIHGKIGGSALMIPSQSENKEQAWAFVEYAALTAEAQAEHAKILLSPAFMPSWDDPSLAEHAEAFYGGQNVLTVFKEAADNTPVSYMTPLDSTASELWHKGITEAIDQGKDLRAALQQIADEVEKAVSVQKAEILQNTE